MDEKPRKKRKRARRYLYIVEIVILIVLIVLGVRFLLSDYFLIEEIGATGNMYHSKDDIVELSGDPRGQNLFRVDTGDIEALLETDPYIEDALVTRSLPNALGIRIQERTEYAAVSCTGGYLLLDQECRVLRATADKPGLPLLEGLNVIGSEPGTIIEVSEKWMLEDTMTLLEDMEASDIYFKKIAISPLAVQVYIYDHLYCEGSPGNILENMDEMQKVVYDLYGKGIRHGVVKVGNDGYFSFNPNPDQPLPVTPDLPPDGEAVEGEAGEAAGDE